MDILEVLTTKDVSEVVKNYTTFLAIVIGGVWTYMMFIRKRQKYPRAVVSHRVIRKKIDDRRILVRAIVVIRNEGDVIIRLGRRRVRIQQMVPWNESVLKVISIREKRSERDKQMGEWKILGEVDLSGKDADFEIEPGESDEFPFDFVISSEVKTVVVNSYFQNIAKGGREIGWNKRSVYDISEERKRRHTMICVERQGLFQRPPQEPEEPPEQGPPDDKKATGEKSGG